MIRCRILQVTDDGDGWLCVDYETLAESDRDRRRGHMDVRSTSQARRAYYAGRVLRLTVETTGAVAS
jgi:hypothetical protein